jgi:Flp pilus assembly protein TadG
LFPSWRRSFLHDLLPRDGACLGRVAQKVQALRDDEKGSVAQIFAVTLIPLAGFSGFALDYARISLARAELQTAIDSAGLAVAHLPRSASVATVEQKAHEWVNVRLAGKGFGPVTITAQRETNGISFAATTTMGLTLFQVLREEPVELTARSEVNWSIGKVEIALVLDNTASMVNNNSPKLKNLKTASASLIDQLEQATAEPGQVKVGIVPFSMTVNIGAGYKNMPWMTGISPVSPDIFTNNTTNKSRFTLFNGMSVNWAGCVESRPSPYDVQDTAPNAGVPATLFVPFFAPDEPDVWEGGGNNPYTNNYLDDEKPLLVSWNWKQRQGNVNKYNKKPKSGTSSSGYKFGPNAGCELQSLLRLTSNMADVRSKITSMTAVGDTNIPIGLVWGWHALSPNLPFADGVPYGTPDLTKYIILMTDGDNSNAIPDSDNKNASYYSGIGYIWQNRLGITGGTLTQRQQVMDGRLSTLCTNIKASGIQIFTVRVEVNSNSSSLLENCASDKEMFFNVSNSADLNEIFGRIGEKITKLHLSK